MEAELGAMPTDVFGRGHVPVGYQYAREDVSMAPAICFEF